ncbi:MAG: flagellar filament capping protein FliD [Gammaproteobacteria bacterium]|nr:flagellar filament capping protein FliD [Gammaproteobacteria bacterium]
MISVPGVGSGLDIGSLVSSLVAFERDPVLNSLGRRQSAFDADISALGRLKSALSSFKTSISTLGDAAAFQKLTTTSSDEDVFTAIADATAVPGKFSIDVRNLAEAHKLITQGFTGETSVVGTGTLTLTVDSVSVNININSSNNTLAGIRAEINDKAASIGVSATLLKVDDGAGGIETKLVLTSANSGTKNAITVTTTDDDNNDIDNLGLSTLVYDPAGSGTTNLTVANAAEDAELRIDGQTVFSDSNTVAGAIEGVTLTLLKEDIGVVKQLAIELDKNAVAEAVAKFIGSYNTVIATVNSLSSFDSKTGATGALFGDATLRSVTGQIRSDISNSVPGLTGTVKSLVDIGISTDSKGLLSLDRDKLDQLAENNLQGLIDLFITTDEGVIARLNTTLNAFSDAGGVIDNRTEGLNRQRKSLDAEFLRLDRRLASLETRLNRQFTALDILLSQLQTSSSFLAQQFESIKNIQNFRNRR